MSLDIFKLQSYRSGQWHSSVNPKFSSREHQVPMDSAYFIMVARRRNLGLRPDNCLTPASARKISLHVKNNLRWLQSAEDIRES
jgi:hypothetical protein